MSSRRPRFFLVALVILATLGLTTSAGAGPRVLIHQWSETCRDVYPHALDVGIYWAQLAPPNTPIPPGDTEPPILLLKACLDQKKPDAFVWGQPTLLITHGAQPGILASGGDRFGTSEGFGALLRVWLALGWNVGVFYWTQFADESIANFMRAEAKIWTPRYFNNMEYTYLPAGGGAVSVGDASLEHDVSQLFVQHYVDHFHLAAGTAQGARGPQAPAGKRRRVYPAEIRLAGHSLGAQLVTRVAWLLLQEPPNNPVRVELLDPVFSPFRQGYLVGEECGGGTVSDALGCYISALAAAGVAPSTYRTSRINLCVDSAEYRPEMLGESAFAHVKLNAWGEQREGNCFNDKLWSDARNFPKRVSALETQVYNQHVMVVPYYMLSLVAPPHLCSGDAHTAASMDAAACIRTKNLALSAAMPTVQVLAWHNRTSMYGEKLCFHELDDNDRSISGSTVTLDPGDDYFYIASCEHTST